MSPISLILASEGYAHHKELKLFRLAQFSLGSARDDIVGKIHWVYSSVKDGSGLCPEHFSIYQAKRPPTHGYSFGDWLPNRNFS